MIEHRCPNCNARMFNGLSIELKLCRDCRGDYPNGSNYISKRVLISSRADLLQYATNEADGQ